MRIIAGAHRGRALTAPEGQVTRPTSERARQALFDMLWHAPWGGRGLIDGARVLDVFAGTGALGLEALSRGAAHVSFIEQDRAALAALRKNITGCKAEAVTSVLPGDATRPPRGQACAVVFLDPPYGKGLVEAALKALAPAGWIAPGAVIIAETAKAEALDLPGHELLTERGHGAAMLRVWRAPG
ncbi:16S rRNA (guanine(966)-N(2))-methyltransferase RsmD [Acetobacteraceae bacterium H6797]|nr:16S rRNA (guanine(966)-N(2))-methyltransferase RsmD [Acetobacteraceae bacterium H6797]